MRLKSFKFYSPSSLGEALELLKQNKGNAKLLAGGTDLVLQMKRKVVTPEVIISLLEIDELRRIEKVEGALRVGATVTHSTLENSELLHDGFQILSSSAKKVGSPQVRNRGTLGGNLCNASPAADTSPAMLVLGAQVYVVSQEGERNIPIDLFFTGPGSCAIEEAEILKDVIIPEQPPETLGVYLKLGRRRGMDVALASVAVLVMFEGKGEASIRRCRIGLGSVSPTPIRAKRAEEFLRGRVLEEKVIQEAGEYVQSECCPISDIRASAEYRKEMVRVLCVRAMKQLMGVRCPNLLRGKYE